jgi:Na+/proline symporter
MLISRLTSRKESNAEFFVASRKSKWQLVAFGMIGSSVSGISLVAVPAMVQVSGFTYLQICLGFIVGYIVVAMVLLPVYYKNNLTSIYGYLEQRFGNFSHKTGSWFFIISKIIISASKLYVAALVLQQFLFSQWNVPFWLTITLLVTMIWLYTFRGGIKTIVFTDALQSLVLFLVIILMLCNMADLLKFSFFDTIKSINSSEFSKTFVFFDVVSPQNFFKQFFSGIFIVIVMTGLSQDMMQTTLSCKNLKEAKKNMLWYGTGFVPLNLLLLALGALMLIFAEKEGVILPDKIDKIVPMFCAQYFSSVVCALFILGIIAATFNSADSALTSIATIFFVDVLASTSLSYRTHKNQHSCGLDPQSSEKKESRNDEVRLRKWVYFGVCVVTVFFVLMFANVQNKSLLDTIYTIVGYAYGPLLGLFAFGLFTKMQVKDRAIPFLAILSPILTYGIFYFCKTKFSYSFGYEILLINGIIMFVMMLIFRK